MKKQKRLTGKALQTLINVNRAVNNGDFEFIGSQFWKSEMISTFNPSKGVASASYDADNIYFVNAHLLYLWKDDRKKSQTTIEDFGLTKGKNRSFILWFVAGLKK